ncbi:HAD hydrolase-like protein [Candidatus Peregrinibacteria bacterium]|nr:HAD hydrolase-like protein [Candidatus Peregrinibacteria bacterium]MBT4631720.1 HAD hydrolase-like protein [Candidatus Peregrinibacteria bacterium]MBT5517263.1 HAD hydrolase-like protein [Candidatus Peregrinibacteria bacterium]MBT5824548.1 HAD hydrolase-like protein [Candidatus Peregrinibacteria bacterium]
MKYFHELDSTAIHDKLILLDVDGTLLADGEVELSTESLTAINALKRKNEVTLCSNKKDHVRNRAVAEQADVGYVETNIRKPNVKILDFVVNEKDLDLLVIGDKYLTDDRFARRIGAEFIKVRRKEKKGFGIYPFFYFIDDLLARIFT